jgi:hypothetical protein
MMNKIIIFLSVAVLSLGCETTDYVQDKPFVPQGPLWPEGNKKGIDNVFDEIINYAKNQQNQNLTSIQKREVSFSKLKGREIVITTRVDDVGAYSIDGSSDSESWRSNEKLGYVKVWDERLRRDVRVTSEVFNPIKYKFSFESNSPDLKHLKNLNKGTQVNIKGKVEDIELVARKMPELASYLYMLIIRVELSEFLEDPGVFY